MREKLSAFQQVDIDQALKNAGESRYNMILIAAHRAREIAARRLIADRAAGINAIAYENKPTVTALKELAAGEYGTEYLDKVARQREINMNLNKTKTRNETSRT